MFFVSFFVFIRNTPLLTTCFRCVLMYLSFDVDLYDVYLCLYLTLLSWLLYIRRSFVNPTLFSKNFLLSHPSFFYLRTGKLTLEFSSFFSFPKFIWFRVTLCVWTLSENKYPIGTIMTNHKCWSKNFLWRHHLSN